MGKRRAALILLALAALLYLARSALAEPAMPSVSDFRRDPAALARQLELCNAKRVQTLICHRAHKARLGAAADILRSNRAARRRAPVPLTVRGSLAI